MKKTQKTPGTKKTLKQILNQEKVAGYVFILPFIIGFMVFLFYPMVMSLAYSFTRYNILKSPVFIGLDNYITMFTEDDLFWKVLMVTVKYVVGKEETAIWVLIILAVWQFGSSMLIFLSGLKQVPVSLYEAATVDGASGITKFFKITLPMLTPTIFFNLINQLISGFMAFTQSYIITEGKPKNSTLFYAVYMYQNAFTNEKLGYSCAMAWFMVAFIGLLTFILFKSQKYWVYYESEG